MMHHGYTMAVTPFRMNTMRTHIWQSECLTTTCTNLVMSSSCCCCTTAGTQESRRVPQEVITSLTTLKGQLTAGNMWHVYMAANYGSLSHLASQQTPSKSLCPFDLGQVCYSTTRLLTVFPVTQNVFRWTPCPPQAVHTCVQLALPRLCTRESSWSRGCV